MINNLFFQEQNFKTVEIKQDIKRSLKEITQYSEFKDSRQQYQATKTKRQKYVKLNKNQNVYAFPCHNDDDVIIFPQAQNKLLKERKQDDDNESDDEIVFQSIQFQIKNLAEALSQANKKQYTIKQILKSDLNNTFFD